MKINPATATWVQCPTCGGRYLPFQEMSPGLVLEYFHVCPNAARNENNETEQRRKAIRLANPIASPIPRLLIIEKVVNGVVNPKTGQPFKQSDIPARDDSVPAEPPVVEKPA